MQIKIKLLPCTFDKGFYTKTKTQCCRGCRAKVGIIALAMKKSTVEVPPK